MKKLLMILFILLKILLPATSQQNPKTDSSGKEPVLDVFINCISCDSQYLKENLKFLNFSRDPKTAEVHIIVTSQVTGSGGEEFMMEFAGRLRFSALHDTLKFIVPPDITQFESRGILLEKLQTGLVPFLLKTPFAKNITVLIDDSEDYIRSNEADKWRNWIFSVDFSGSAAQEKSYSNFSLISSLYASKVTSEIKLELFAGYNFMESTYRFWDADTLIDSYISTWKDFGFNGLLVKSLGGHFGVGCFGLLKNSSYGNLDLQIRFEPAIEYSYFQYSDASRRQLRFLYSIGYEYSDYCLPTIYNQTCEGLFRQNLNIGFRMLEKFGSVEASLSGSNYLHDLSYFDLGADFRGNVQIFRGFSVNASFTIEMPRNQISIPGAELSPEDQISGQREMQTDYRFSGGLGFSYFFGSKNNNTVNPRFTF